MTEPQIIANFFGEILGAVFSFLLHIFTEVELWGINVLEILFIGIVAFAVIWVAKLVL